MEAKTKTEYIKNACAEIVIRKGKKAKENLRTEYGYEFVKMSDMDFLRLTERENKETGQDLENDFRHVLKTVGKQRFIEYLNECKEYSNEDFLKDIETSFGQNWSNFLKTEILRNANNNAK